MIEKRKLLSKHTRLDKAFKTLSMTLALALSAGVASGADTATSSLWAWTGNSSAMVDGNTSTFWKSASAVKATDWVMVDLGALKTVTTVDLYMTSPSSPNDRIQNGYIEISADKTTWTNVGGFANTNEVHLALPTGLQARYVRVRSAVNQSNLVVVRELTVDRQLTSSSMSMSNIGASTDSDRATFWKSDRAPTTTDWIMLDQGRSLPVTTVDLQMAEPASPDARIQAGVIEVSNDSASWTPIGAFANTSDVRVTAPTGTTARYLRARSTINQPGLVAVREFSAINQPGQPTSGPGSSDYVSGDMRVSSGGSGANAWFVFEPITPKPTSAPLAIIMHGYTDFSGYGMHEALIRHTVRKGNVVIYPRWQTSMITPCVGSYNIEPCMNSSLAGIRGALAYLQADPTRVQPQLDKTSYFGFSFGGILTANLANRHVALGLPKPRAIFLDDPHDGGHVGADEPALDDSLTGIPSTTLLECHVGVNGIISIEGRANGSCNSLFPKLGHIPAANKALVLSYTDTHGGLDLSSAHGVSTGDSRTAVLADAYDWNFLWKVWDALRNAAYYGTDREYALDDTPQHRSIGVWSDGVSITTLKVQKEAPIKP